METVAPSFKDMPSRTNWLKEELANTIQKETANLMSVFNRQHSNFRAVNGLPICFYCKRLGHVKKYCRTRKSRLENEIQPAVDLRQVKECDTYTGTSRICEEEVCMVKGQEIVKSDEAVDVMSELGRLFRNLQIMADELQKQISSVYNCSDQCELFGEFETSLFKAEMQVVVDKVGEIVSTLVSPPNACNNVHKASKVENQDPASRHIGSGHEISWPYLIPSWADLSHFQVT